MRLRPLMRPFFLFFYLLLLVGCERTTLPTATNEKLINQQLQQAQEQLDLNRPNAATTLLNELEFEELNIAQQTTYAELTIDIALVLEDGVQALDWLDRYANLFDGLPMERQVELSFKRIRAYELIGGYLLAAQERVKIAPFLKDEAAIFNHERLWFNLQLADESELENLRLQPLNAELDGWLELASLVRQTLNDLRRQVLVINDWVKQNPLHPAAIRLPGDLANVSQFVEQEVNKIAVLLPLSGPLAQAGKALTTGILSTWFEASQAENSMSEPELLFFDTASNQRIQALYEEALAAGAELILGPLDKQKVNELHQQIDPSIPILALNYSEYQTTAKHYFYQLGLSPEQEAEQVAEMAWQQGNRRAMVLAPNSDWGKRVADAFIRKWQLEGGEITSKALYTRPDQYLNTIKTALNIHDSEQRQRNLTSLLGQTLEFEARRRQDVDMVFMVAFPAQARQLKPLLNYQFAADLPVFSTSHLYSGVLDAERDRDLNNVHFIGMPWLLETQPLSRNISQLYDEKLTGFESLVALGIDAYRLHPRLTQLDLFPQNRFSGVTGILSMNERRQLRRQLRWMKFQNGLAQPLSTWN